MSAPQQGEAAVDIYIVGLGISPADHVTPETDRVLRRCREVLFVDAGVATRPFLEARCDQVTDLFRSSYADGEDRMNAYHDMAARVVEAALDHPPVAFALQGHPVVFAYPPFLVRDMADLLGLRVEVLPGISAMDSLFAELMVDPGPEGLQMYEATDLLLRRRPLHSDVPLLVWQVGSLESRRFSLEVSGPERFHRFRDYMLQFYPEEHPVTALYASPHPLMESAVFQFALGRIGEHADMLGYGITLYVPPASIRPVLDAELYHRQLDDPRGGEVSG